LPKELSATLQNRGILFLTRSWEVEQRSLLLQNLAENVLGSKLSPNTATS